ncbi:uncharacterized protein LOC143485597 [Brachyhypopomus gauderio]|uniref:uncharacterized protein LOC143485597 n=1 Tax=Brachyhypopomus gauderio TaxID=698409 RepID=UPI0040434DEF
MGGSLWPAGTVSSPNRVASVQDAGSTETRAQAEFKVFNIIILSLAACALTMAAAVCCVSCCKRRRWWKRACAYESAVAGGSGEELVCEEVERRRSVRNIWTLLWEQKPPRDVHEIYYIYSNALAVGRQEMAATPHAPPILLDSPC